MSPTPREGATEPSESVAPDLRILTPGTTAAEIAAVTAVLQAALDDLAETAAAQSGPVVSAWQRSQRPIRTPLTPGPGSWRGFAG